MRYWKQMDSKYGFDNGSLYPFGIDLYRDVYVRNVNRLAAEKGSSLRVVPFDRTPDHDSWSAGRNYCLILVVTKEWFEQTFIPRLLAENGSLMTTIGLKRWPSVNLENWPDPDNLGDDADYDQAFLAALGEAYDMELDTLCSQYLRETYLKIF